MAKCPEGVPWWRVVAKNGTLPVWKKDPDAESRQISLLQYEGVEVIESRIAMDRFAIQP